jgi:hypothetical protein
MTEEAEIYPQSKTLLANSGVSEEPAIAMEADP